MGCVAPVKKKTQGMISNEYKNYFDDFNILKPTGYMIHQQV